VKKAFYIACMALLAAGCSTGTKSQTSTATSSPSGASGSSVQKCQNNAPLPTVRPGSASPQSKPSVNVPSAAPPCRLVIHDIVKGTGAEAKAGATVTVQYLGVSWSTKQQFDSSWDRGQPATFALSQVIPGWTQGIPGMKEGGRRELVIPPSLGYGAPGSPPSIGPNETLVFVIDLIKAS
jgi:peptidylprolyl isomerase